MATIAGQILNAFLYLAYIRRFKSIKLEKESFRISVKVMAKVSSLGISSFITQIAIVLVMAVTNNILVSYGAQSEYGAEIPLTTIGITASFSWSLTEGVWGRFLLCGKNDLYHSCYVWKKLYFCRKI